MNGTLYQMTIKSKYGLANISLYYGLYYGYIILSETTSLNA